MKVGGLGILVVLVILEGGIDVINDVMVFFNYNIFVVVCLGIGWVVDILVYVYFYSR